MTNAITLSSRIVFQSPFFGMLFHCVCEICGKVVTPVTVAFCTSGLFYDITDFLFSTQSTDTKSARKQFAAIHDFYIQSVKSCET